MTRSAPPTRMPGIDEHAALHSRRSLLTWLCCLGLALIVLGVSVLLGGCGQGQTAPPRAERELQERKEWTSLVDGKVVLEKIKSLCALGPRAPGTTGIRKARSWIEKELREYAGYEWKHLHRQKFTAKTPDPKEPNDAGAPDEETFTKDIEFVNLVAVLPGKKKSGIAFAAHYDTKIFDFPFVGANDAASAVAGVLELARVLRAEAASKPREHSVYFIFFDGEESVRADWNDPDNRYGSRHFVEQMGNQGDSFAFPLTGLVLLDMIGARDVQYADENNSDAGLRLIFKNTAREIFGYEPFVIPPGDVIQDDHVSFKGTTVRVIDLIDANFSNAAHYRPIWWHTENDLPEMIDVRALERTLTLVLTALPAVEAACNPR